MHLYTFLLLICLLSVYVRDPVIKSQRAEGKHFIPPPHDPLGKCRGLCRDSGWKERGPLIQRVGEMRGAQELHTGLGHRRGVSFYHAKALKFGGLSVNRVDLTSTEILAYKGLETFRGDAM